MGSNDRGADRYRSLVDALSDIVYERDFEGRITEINVAGARFFGRPREAMLGGTFHELDARAYASLQATNVRLLEAGEDRSTVTMANAAGEERTLESVTTLIRDADGRPWGARGVMRDVTERVRLEEELRRQAVELASVNDALRAADRMKARLASMLVHDLRTPLTLLTAIVDLVASRGEAGDLVELARKACQEMEHLIDEALELYRPQGGAPPLQKEEMTLAAILDGPVSAASVVAAQHGVRVEVRMGPDLPPVEVDPARMRRVVSNLLSNAVKFSHTGGTVVVSATVLGSGAVEVAVEDSGPGIGAADLPHLFDPYYQARHSKAGTGLGLAIVRGIVEAHGGRVGVVSGVGRGSRFAVEIPPAPRVRPR